MRSAIEARLRHTLDDPQLSDPVDPAIGDFDLNPGMRQFVPAGRSLRRAAVLVPIIDRPEGLSVLLTRRTEHLSSHAGQISFPGGRIDPEDAGPVEAALREAQEEIGLDPGFVTIAGFLDGYETGTGYHVTPVVGFLRPGFALTPNPDEVAAAFEVPLEFLMNPKNRERHSRDYNGATRYFYAMPFGEHYIWGATAGMIVNLAMRLGFTEEMGQG
ncbi:CoA pyrophosphatase [Oleomonas cavernae]|uniref:CoA pyrophosphatase n=1 Tax=Oleomonas cavernae TaxID=2320859 RepID=A0A418WCX1_9PROT|nr:CoA pyrophosphatase [Oleomonas cavernae]RJF87882.1 CoA pyrophosphatase [Oleomonas cavernae]